jgi:hypothetical protein
MSETRTLASLGIVKYKFDGAFKGFAPRRIENGSTVLLSTLVFGAFGIA